MSMLQTVRQWFRPARSGARAVSAVVTSGRATYAGTVGIQSTLSRAESFTLLGQFWRNVPPLKRTVEILAGYVGCPEIVCESEAATEEVQAWAQSVAFGYIGQGLAPWVRDHLAQALKYGFGVGEVEVAPDRREVGRLWSYTSPAFGFRSNTAGALEVVQQQSTGLKVLDPLTVVTTTHNAEGCNPNGDAQFSSVVNVAQTLIDIWYARRADWRRRGVRTFHVNWEPPTNFDDPDATIATEVRNALQTAWNESIRSQVVDGVAKDFVSTGKVAITSIGMDGEPLEMEADARAMLEQILVAAGIPPFLLGLSWSTTERMSTQQADMLLTFVEYLRQEVEGSIRKVVSLRQQLAARRNGLAFELDWPDVNLQDALQTAQAETYQANADLTRQRYWRQLWTDGVIDQARYAEELTGDPAVARRLPEPPSAAPAATAQAGNSASLSAPAWQVRREQRAAYPGFHGCRCGHKAGADDPVQLFPDEEPQYPGLRREIERAWAATREAVATLRRKWLAALGYTEQDLARDAAPAGSGKALPRDVRRQIEAAIEAFLRAFAGGDRSADGFARSDAEDGVLQQAIVLADAAGSERGRELTRWPMNPALTDAQREALLRDAFAGMSDDGRLRFEGRLEEIRDECYAAFGRGDNPLEVARELSRDLDGYERGRLKTILRTEMGEAAEGGCRRLYGAAGVERVEVIGDPNTDAACTRHIGQVYELTDTDNLPLYHPNCFCSHVPADEEEPEE